MYWSIHCRYSAALESAMPNGIQEAGFPGFRAKVYNRAGTCSCSPVEDCFIFYLICSNSIYHKWEGCHGEEFQEAYLSCLHKSGKYTGAVPRFWIERRMRSTHFNDMSNVGTGNYIIVDTKGKLIFCNDFMQKSILFAYGDGRWGDNAKKEENIAAIGWWACHTRRGKRSYKLLLTRGFFFKRIFYALWKKKTSWCWEHSL